MGLHMRYLQDMKEKEIAKNKKRAKILGEEVHFGQAIQLEHLASGRYIAISTLDLAEKDKECMRVSLADEGEECWLNLEPRFKVRDHSAKVLIQDQVLVTNHSGAQTSMTCLNPNFTGQTYFNDARHEVNAALKHTEMNGHAWRLSRYRPCRKDDSAKLLCCGMAVRLHHPEVSCIAQLVHMLCVAASCYVCMDVLYNFAMW
jgi:hypothetical protein